MSYNTNIYNKISSNGELINNIVDYIKNHKDIDPKKLLEIKYAIMSAFEKFLDLRLSLLFNKEMVEVGEVINTSTNIDIKSNSDLQILIEKLEGIIYILSHDLVPEKDRDLILDDFCAMIKTLNLV